MSQLRVPFSAICPSPFKSPSSWKPSLNYNMGILGLNFWFPATNGRTKSDIPGSIQALSLTKYHKHFAEQFKTSHSKILTEGNVTTKPLRNSVKTIVDKSSINHGSNSHRYGLSLCSSSTRSSRPGFDTFHSKTLCRNAAPSADSHQPLADTHSATVMYGSPMTQVIQTSSDSRSGSNTFDTFNAYCELHNFDRMTHPDPSWLNLEVTLKHSPQLFNEEGSETAASHLDLAPLSQSKSTVAGVQHASDACVALGEGPFVIALDEASGELFIQSDVPKSIFGIESTSSVPSNEELYTSENAIDNNEANSRNFQSQSRVRFDDIDLDASFGQSATDLDDWAIDAPSQSQGEQSNGQSTVAWEQSELESRECEETSSVLTSSFGQSEQETTDEYAFNSRPTIDNHLIGSRLSAKYEINPTVAIHVEQLIHVHASTDPLLIQACEYWKHIQALINQKRAAQGFPPKVQMQESQPDRILRELLGLGPKPCSPMEEDDDEDVATRAPVHHYNLLKHPIFEKSQTPPALSYVITYNSARKLPIDEAMNTWKAVVSAQAAKWIDPCSLIEEIPSNYNELHAEGNSKALLEFATGRTRIFYEP